MRRELERLWGLNRFHHRLGHRMLRPIRLTFGTDVLSTLPYAARVAVPRPRHRLSGAGVASVSCWRSLTKSRQSGHPGLSVFMDHPGTLAVRESDGCAAEYR